MTLEEQHRLLLMKALDGDLSHREEEEFRRLLQESKEFQEEWKSLSKLKEVTSQMRFSNPPAEIWEKYWTNVYYRLERGVAWILVSLGAIVLLTYGGFKAVESILADTTLALALKIALLAIMAGFAILIVSVIREKWITGKIDKYKEVLR